MAVTTVARYTGSILELILSLGLLAIAAFHAAWGVPFAILPAIGGFVLLGAAVSLAPLTRHRFRRYTTEWDDVVVFLGALVIAAVTLGGFVALGHFF
jgi:membrane protein YdbS with pleckstrin-like domain